MPTQPTGHPTECEKLDALLPSLALGLLDADDAARAQTLLARCPEAADALADYQAMHKALHRAVPLATPSASLGARILAAAVSQPSVGEMHMVVPEKPQRRLPVNPQQGLGTARRTRPALWGLAAAVLVLVVSNGLWAAQASRLAGQASNAQGQLQQQDRLIALLSAAASQRVQLASTTTSGPAVNLYWVPDSTEALLAASQLASLPAEQAYQFWLIGPDGPVSGGLFRPDDAGRALLVVPLEAGLDAYDAVGVSVEPASGSDAPTTTPILLEQL